MYKHAPKNYICPLCLIAEGIENESVETKQQDIICQDEFIIAFISSRWWSKNPGHVIIIPNKHFENIYDISRQWLHQIIDFAKEVAIAFKKIYQCDGTSVRQHNEPGGDQDVFHYHLHVFPRYKDDNLYLNHLKKKFTPPKKRLVYAQKLKEYFQNK